MAGSKMDGRPKGRKSPGVKASPKRQAAVKAGGGKRPPVAGAADAVPSAAPAAAVPLPTLFEKYWTLRVRSAQAKLDAALEIIHHNPTRGSVAEGVVLNLIHEYLPRRWDAGTGFLIGVDNVSSEQIDVLVFDTLATLPLYRDGELVVLPPTATRAAVEVKKVLEHEGTLADAIQNLSSVKAADVNIACMLFVFESLTAERMVGHLGTVLAKLRVAAGFNPALLPDTILLMQRNTILSRAPADSGKVYFGYQPAVPIVRFLITQVLATLTVTSLQPFMKAPEYGQAVFTL